MRGSSQVSGGAEEARTLVVEHVAKHVEEDQQVELGDEELRQAQIGGRRWQPGGCRGSITDLLVDVRLCPVAEFVT